MRHARTRENLYVHRIAPVLVLPGEAEMLSLAQGALRVLLGQEQAKKF